MTEPRDMTLGGRTFQVPALPLGVNIKAYPVLRKLNNGGFLDRWFDPASGPTEEDMADLTGVLFVCANLADPTLTRQAFDVLPATPSELLDGLQVAKFQSGGWVPTEAGAGTGEGRGEPKPPTSTSAESSPG